MATKLIEKGNSVYEVTTSVKGQEWKDAQDKAFKKLAENVSVKGFRKGKAPLNLAKEHINPANMFDEAINIALPSLYGAVIEEHKLNPIYRPGINVTKISDSELEVTFHIICVPAVTLGKYTGIKIAKEAVKVSADEVKAAVQHVLEENAEWVLKEDQPAAKGDTVVIDFKGYVDGKEFDGGAAENYSLVLGSNSFIPGFEDQLVGAKSEQKVDVNVKFPDQYVKELAGKSAKFVCMVHEIKTKKIPELNDELVKGLKIDGVEDVKGLEEQQKEIIKNRKNQEVENKHFSAVVSEIIKNAKIEMADEILANETEAVKQESIQQMQQNGLTFEQYKEITGATDEALRAQFEIDAKARLSQFLVFNKIAETEKLTVNQQELDKYFADAAAQYNVKVEDVKKAFAGQEGRIIQQLTTQKIEKFIIENNSDEAAPKKEAAPKAEAKAAPKKAPAKKKEEAK